MQPNATPTEHRLPFGLHRDKLLSEVPSGYLSWLVRTCKLSSVLRQAVADEQNRRGIDCPAPPLPPLVPPCRRCGRIGFRAHWQETRQGDRRIRADCLHCGRWIVWLPKRPPFVDEAGQNASPTPILDALTRLEALGIEPMSDGETIRFAGDDWRRVPQDLYAIVRQCSHQLARMLGRNVRRP